MSKIYLDFDGTLNNLPEVWLNWVNENFNTNYGLKDITHYNFISEELGDEANLFWKTSGCYQCILPYAESQIFVEELKNLFGINNIKIITSSPEGMNQEKELYIEKNFNIKSENIIHTYEKWHYTHDGILVDDAKHQIIAHIDRTGNNGIIFNKDMSYGWSKFNHVDILKMNENTIKKCHIATSYAEILNLLKTF